MQASVRVHTHTHTHTHARVHTQSQWPLKHAPGRVTGREECQVLSSAQTDNAAFLITQWAVATYNISLSLYVPVDES